MKTSAKKTDRTVIASEPGSSLANKTGSWRSLKPATDLKACIGCSLCAKVCPEGCIAMRAADDRTGSRPRPETDYDYCKGCGLCAHECPVQAIRMEKDF